MILGVDFLKKHRLVLDFTSTPIGVTSRAAQLEEDCPALDLQPIWKAAQKVLGKACAVASSMELTDETLDDCTVPLFSKPLTPNHEMPHCPLPHLSSILDEYKDLFWTSPGYTDLASTSFQHLVPL